MFVIFWAKGAFETLIVTVDAQLMRVEIPDPTETLATLIALIRFIAAAGRTVLLQR